MDEMKVLGIDRQKLEKLLKDDIQRCIAEVTEAIDTARIGAIIDDSEEPVRMATFVSNESAGGQRTMAVTIPLTRSWGSSPIRSVSVYARCVLV